MFKRIMISLAIISFVLVEPIYHLAEANGTPLEICTQHAEKIVQQCYQQSGLQEGAVAGLNDALSNSAQTVTNGTQLQKGGQDAIGDLERLKIICDNAFKQCMADCNRVRSSALSQPTKPDLRTVGITEQQMKQCQQESQKANAQKGGAIAEIAKLLAAIGGLVAALKGNDNEQPEADDLPEPPSSSDGQDKCDSPEGALLVECAGASDPLVSRASMDGATGVGSSYDGLGNALSRPLTGDPSVTGSSANDPATAGSAGGGSLGSGFAAAGGLGSSAAAIPVQDAERGADKDLYKGFMEGGGGGGGGGTVSGGGGKFADYKPFSFDDPLAKGKAAQDKNLKGKIVPSSGGARGLAGIKDTDKGGPFQDNFVVVKEAYKQATPSLDE